MGTVVTIDIFTSDGVLSAAGWVELSRARASLQRADAVFSTWKADSPMSRLRRGEINIGEAPPEVADVLDACEKAKAMSRGWFDPWSLPGGVDPTGYVKGWAAQRALEAFEAPEISGVIVNAAGDIASRGCLPDGKRFRVGIADPARPAHISVVIELVGAVATSGTYLRGDHLFDPYLRQRLARAASASVCGPDLGVADALATALGVAGGPALTVIDGVEGYSGLVITTEGELLATSGFPFAADT